MVLTLSMITPLAALALLLTPSASVQERPPVTGAPAQLIFESLAAFGAYADCAAGTCGLRAERLTCVDLAKRPELAKKNGQSAALLCAGFISDEQGSTSVAAPAAGSEPVLQLRQGVVDAGLVAADVDAFRIPEVQCLRRGNATGQPSYECVFPKGLTVLAFRAPPGAGNPDAALYGALAKVGPQEVCKDGKCEMIGWSIRCTIRGNAVGERSYQCEGAVENSAGERKGFDVQGDPASSLVGALERFGVEADCAAGTCGIAVAKASCSLEGNGGTPWFTCKVGDEVAPQAVGAGLDPR
jgi:hypothetical protein